MPIISNDLREKTLSLAANHNHITDRMHLALSSLDGVRSISPAIRQDILNSVAHSVRLWFQTLLTGTFPSAEDLEEFHQLAYRSVHQFVPLESVVHAFRKSSRELWQAYIELAKPDVALHEELLFGISPYMFDYYEVVSRSISDAYHEEQQRQGRWRESLRHLLCNSLFYAPHDVDGFQHAASALGLDPTAPRAALALDVELNELDSSIRNEEIDRVTLAASRHLKVTANELVRAWHRDRLVIWAPLRRGESINVSDRLLFERTIALSQSLPKVRKIGVGLPNEGARGWAASADEALKAIDFAITSGAQGKVHLYSSIVIEDSARRSDNASRYLGALLQQLSNEPELFLTLKIYLEQKQRRRQSAQVLGIHPNTLNYRIERIETLLGGSLDDIAWLAKLDIALKLRHANAVTP